MKSLDIERSRVWYNRAIDNGNSFAKLYAKNFEHLRNIEINERIDSIMKWKLNNGLNGKCLTLKERSERFKSQDMFEYEIQLKEEYSELKNSIINKRLSPKQ